MIELRLFGSTELRRDDGAAVQSVLAQPKRLALLAWLALARPHGFHRRDTIVAVFWPELDAEHARAALRKTIFHLRQALFPDVIVNRGDEEVGLGSAVWCDAAAFADAVAAGRHEEALALYRGELLPGFYLPDVPEWEHWLERERERLRRQAVASAWSLADAAEASGGRGAVEWARRAVELAPDDEAALRRFLSALERSGDSGAALRAYAEHRVRLADACGGRAEPATEALVAAIRTRIDAARLAGPIDGDAAPALTHPPLRPADPAGPAPARAVGVDSEGGSAGAASAVAAPPASRWMRVRGWRVPAWLATAGLAIVILAWTRDSPEGPVTVAIGSIGDFTGAGAASGAEALPDLLATNLSRVAAVQVVSPARLHELQAGRTPRAGAAAVLAAARHAGVDQLIEGALHRQPDGSLRLDLRRVRLRGGDVLSSHTVVGTDVFAVVDAGTSELLNEWGAGTAALRIADVTTRSLVAYRFYQQGLRFYFRGDLNGASRLFDAALEEDSTFAMAAYYAALSNADSFERSRGYLTRALAMLQHAAPRERLLIRARMADIDEDPARLAIAETLAARYPLEPDGQVLYGRMLTWAGDFEAAIPRLRRVLALDSASRGWVAPAQEAAGCSACAAFQELVTAYTLADSAAAAESVARQWMSRVPSSLSALDALANTLEYQHRLDEAMAVRRSASAEHPAAAGLGVGLWPSIYAIRGGDWDAADRFLRLRLDVGTPAERHDALWVLTIGLRHQGRYREALASARQLRPLQNPPYAPGGPPPYNALTEAIVLFEMGRPREAAALWDSIASAIPAAGVTGRQARQRTWLLTHAATALHAAGDTVALKRLIPVIESFGRQSAYGRDHRLHHHVRGLLHAARGDDAAAAAAFRQAIFSTTAGYTRTNLELARTLLRLGRPAEAIPVLRSALRGPIGASNLYVTHTDLRATLATAFERAGQPDSAAVHRCWVARALTRADAGAAPVPAGC